jgi:hypothetical protein
LRACGRIQLANALIMGVLPLWEANVMSFWRNMGRKAKISGYFIALVFWETD